MSAESHTHELHIVGAGFGRTGTLSLKTALDILGYKCYHVAETFDHLADWKDWYTYSKLNSMQKKDWDWNIIFGPRKYTAAVDTPTSDVWETIWKFYNEKKENRRKKSPENSDPKERKHDRVKVILTIRDTPEQWYTSVQNSIRPISKQGNRWFSKVYMGHEFSDCLKAFFWDGSLEGRCDDKDFVIQKYLERIDDVKQKVPEKDLLILNNKQGWKPLCDFLEVDIPVDPVTGDPLPFPLTNTTPEFQKRIAGLKFMNDAVNVLVVGLGIGALFGGAYYLKRKKII